jgi:hypothetical protein
MHVRTYELYHHHLVTKKKMEPYDFNQDRMLEKFEYSQYLADKDSGRIKDVYQKYKTKEKKQRKERKEQNQIRENQGLRF